MKISVKSNLPSYTSSLTEKDYTHSIYINRIPTNVNVINQEVVTFETISQNIKANNATPLFYGNGNLLSYTQNTNQGDVVKTFIWDENNNPVSIVLSGAIPPTIKTTKNLDWSTEFPTITYS